jgi:hypothetical protein
VHDTAALTRKQREDPETGSVVPSRAHKLKFRGLSPVLGGCRRYGGQVRIAGSHLGFQLRRSCPEALGDAAGTGAQRLGSSAPHRYLQFLLASLFDQPAGDKEELAPVAFGVCVLQREDEPHE